MPKTTSICAAVSIQYRRVRDRQTDRQTHTQVVIDSDQFAIHTHAYNYTVSQKTTLTLHTITSIHINQF